VGDPVRIADVQEYTLRPPEQTRVVLDCVALCRCVDDAEHLIEVVLQELPSLDHGRHGCGLVAQDLGVP